MEVVNMPGLFKEVQKEGVGVLDHKKYGFIVDVLSGIWDQNSMGEDTEKFTRANAKQLIVKMYDHYNDSEEANDALEQTELRQQFKLYAYGLLESI